MNQNIFTLILLHSWLVVWVAVCGGFIVGKFGQKYYHSRFNLDKYFLPQELVTEKITVGWFRALFFVALPFGLLAYLVPLMRLLAA
ncbi:MAG: hypothetical protein Q7S32_03385 [bacterium]|nr:hypothetical protein [bacterium]